MATFKLLKETCPADTKSDRAEICAALVARPQAGMGEHSDLWMLLDAFVHTTEADLDKEQRLRASAVTWELAVRTDRDFRESQSSGFDTLNLYRAVLAQAVLCQRFESRLDCADGLPRQLRATLDRAAHVALRDGIAAAPYAVGLRKPALERLIGAGLITDRADAGTSEWTDFLTGS